jgi:4-hydroxybenzoate polyprenyltransferase
MPQRPIPSGLLTATDALVVTAVITLLGLIAAFFSALALWSVMFWVIGVLYNWKYKAMVMGNLMVATPLGSRLFCGIAVGNLHKAVWFFG